MVLKLKGMLRAPILALVWTLLGCGPAVRPAPQAGRVWVEREAFVMGTRLRIEAAAATREAGLAAVEGAFGEVRRLDGVLSSWRPESEIGRLNGAPAGEAVAVSEELWSLLSAARAWSERTGGAFDPAVGALIDAWAVRGEGRRPGAGELAAARAATGLAGYRFDAAARTVSRAHGAAWLDTGGFGKGVALEAAERELRAAGVEAALLDFGGQVQVFGAPPGGGAGWEIAVAHPSRREEAVSALRLREGAVATSSQSERFVTVAGERFGHVLDPRTGIPVPAWGSVTVVAEDAVTADVLSTALLVMGPATGRSWAQRQHAVGVLFLEEREGEVVASWNSAFEQYRLDHSTDQTRH